MLCGRAKKTVGRVLLAASSAHWDLPDVLELQERQKAVQQADLQLLQQTSQHIVSDDIKEATATETWYNQGSHLKLSQNLLRSNVFRM